MGTKFLWAAALLFVLVGRFQCCDGCLEEERVALLQLKSFFNAPDSLNDWVQGNESSSNCCQWEMVICNATTGRVTALYLNYTKDRNWVDDYWYLNVSLFFPFQELKNLSLSQNNIVGCIENEGFDRLSPKLSYLEMLDLTGNVFNNSILPSLVGFSSIKSLHLGFNRFNGSVDINGFQQLSKLGSLETFDLYYCGLNNSILSTLAELSSLKFLGLSYNQLEGSLNINEFDALIHLETLYLAGNDIKKFVGQHKGVGKLQELSLSGLDNAEDSSILLESMYGLFPSLRSFEFRNGVFNPSKKIQETHYFSNVEELYLWDSSFVSSSNILSLFPSLKRLSLEYCNTSDTQLEGLLSMKNLESLNVYNLNYLNNFNLDISFLHMIGKLTSLKNLELSNTGLSGRLPFKGGLYKLKSLETLDLSNNNLTGALPLCLANLTSLKALWLGANHFIGDISESPLKSLTSLQMLDLRSNHFRIPISFEPFYNHSNLKRFNGDNNEIYVDSNLHLSIWTPKFQLSYLSLSCCRYGGLAAFPKFLSNQHDLKSVDLSHIHLWREFPYWLLENNTKLYSLMLVNNSLRGPFKLPFHSHRIMSELDVSNNFFDDYNIPIEIGSVLPSLSHLNMSHNNFHGNIPSSLGGMHSNCKIIDFSYNQLKGSIPLEFCQLNLLRTLDLSDNNISGIPSCFSPPYIKHLHLSKNKLQGLLTTQFYNSSSLVTLDLSNNHLTSYIPDSFHRLHSLSYLLLNNNRFKGEIPVDLCQLGKLTVINLSHNNLSGLIPSCLNISISYDDLWTNPFGDFEVLTPDEPIQITTKRMSYYYKGNILSLMYGIDLSYNKLTGEIPQEIGNLSKIRLLNLSYNNLRGGIPTTFSNLMEIECLDLSYNNLSGTIPPQLIGLHSLSSFNVSYNNLSGKILERTQQFATFDESSYKGNSFLCGDPLPSCSRPEPSSSPPNLSFDNKDVGLIDMETFIVSFSVTYVMVQLAIAVVLYINPNWRQAWFYYIELGITSCHYFVLDNLIPKSFQCENL